MPAYCKWMHVLSAHIGTYVCTYVCMQAPMYACEFVYLWIYWIVWRVMKTYVCIHIHTYIALTSLRLEWYMVCNWFCYKMKNIIIFHCHTKQPYFNCSCCYGQWWKDFQFDWRETDWIIVCIGYCIYLYVCMLCICVFITSYVGMYICITQMYICCGSAECEFPFDSNASAPITSFDCHCCSADWFCCGRFRHVQYTCVHM